MAQSARDFIFWPAMTVAAQDAIWAVGNPNATDICLRCHMPGGWLGGRSDPTNGSLMTGIDFDGIRNDLGVPDHFRVEAAVAIGRRASPETLP